MSAALASSSIRSERWLPLIGSKEGIANVALAFVDPGDLVLVPDPGYPTYSLGTLMAGGQVLSPAAAGRERLSARSGGHPGRRGSPRPRILWLNYPNNPTGAVAPLGVL